MSPVARLEPARLTRQRTPPKLATIWLPSMNCPEKIIGQALHQQRLAVHRLSAASEPVLVHVDCYAERISIVHIPFGIVDDQMHRAIDDHQTQLTAAIHPGAHAADLVAGAIGIQCSPSSRSR